MFVDYRYDKFQANLEIIIHFIKNYTIRKNILDKEIDLNQIGRYLLSLLDQDITLENYYFIFQSSFDSTMEVSTKLPNSDIFMYNEGEYRFIIYYKSKPIYVAEIMIISNEEVFLRQIQGIEKANINPEVNWDEFLFRFIEIWAKNMNFRKISLYSSKCLYERSYKKGISQEIKDRTEQKYDDLGKRLGLQLDSENCFYRNI